MGILFLTKSLFILILGLVGIVGGYFYTAGPVRLGYRGFGEILIALLFGILPVYGSYFLQTGKIDLLPFVPALIISLHVFLIILINEFPDAKADAAVNKRTLVVLFGAEKAVIIYQLTLPACYIIAVAAAAFVPTQRPAMFLYLLTCPVAFAALKFLRPDALADGGKLRPNKFTILLHLLAGVLICAGFIIRSVS